MYLYAEYKNAVNQLGPKITMVKRKLASWDGWLGDTSCKSSRQPTMKQIMPDRHVMNCVMSARRWKSFRPLLRMHLWGRRPNWYQRSPLRCCTSIIWSSALVQVSSSLSMVRNRNVATGLTSSRILFSPCFRASFKMYLWDSRCTFEISALEDLATRLWETTCSNVLFDSLLASHISVAKTQNLWRRGFLSHLSHPARKSVTLNKTWKQHTHTHVNVCLCLCVQVIVELYDKWKMHRSVLCIWHTICTRIYYVYKCILHTYANIYITYIHKYASIHTYILKHEILHEIFVFL